MSIETLLFCVFMIGIVLWIIWDLRRRKRRRDSLHYDRDSGVFVWVDFDGSTQRSTKDPRDDDGAWADSDGGGDSGGDGGGGD